MITVNMQMLIICNMNLRKTIQKYFYFLDWTSGGWWWHTVVHILIIPVMIVRPVVFSYFVIRDS